MNDMRLSTIFLVCQSNFVSEYCKVEKTNFDWHIFNLLQNREQTSFLDFWREISYNKVENFIFFQSKQQVIFLKYMNCADFRVK
jgi:hypothetical protein